MGVVNKILTVGNNTDRWDDVLNELQSADITNTYDACVRFIEWYKENRGE